MSKNPEAQVDPALISKPIAKGAIGWMAGHKVAANLLMLACIVGGLLMIGQIKQEVFPDMDTDTVTISVAYPGTSPEEVERGVILPIEQAVEGLDGVKKVTSKASEGNGTVTVEALTGTNLDQLGVDVKNEVDRITTLPEEAEEPSVNIKSMKRQAVRLAVYGNVPMQTLHQEAETVRSALQRHHGITQVELAGLPDVEVAVNVPLDNLKRYNLTLGEIASKVGAGSVEVSSGGIDTTKGEVLLRVNERRDIAAEFADVPVVTTSDGSEVTLGDIATISDGYEDSGVANYYDGQPALFVLVYRVGDQNPISVSDAVTDVIKGLELPTGIQLTIDEDSSLIFRERVDLLLRNAFIGLVLVLIILGLFMEPRVAFWVMMGIPISFLGSFLFLKMTGVSINMVSLFAYLMVLGIVVDDAVVVGENIFHYRQQGYSPLKAAIAGAREVGVPVVFSILTNIAMFMPLAFVPGMMGKIFRLIPVVVTLVFLVSLIESLFVLPAHLAHLKSESSGHIFRLILKWQNGFSRGFEKFVSSFYLPSLALVVRYRYAFVAAMFAVLVAFGGFAASGRMGFSLMPQADSDYSQATLVLPYGAASEKTEALARRIEKAAYQVMTDSGFDGLIKHTDIRVGTSGTHTATIRATLADADIRQDMMNTSEFTQKWRAAVGDLSGIDHISFKADAGGPGSGAAITVELSHDDTDVLEKASRELAEILRQYPTAHDVDDGYQPGKPQLDFTLRPEAKLLGLSANAIGQQVRQAFYGAEARRLQRGRDEVKVMIRLNEDERESETTLSRLLIKTPYDTWVPLTSVTNIERGRAYTTIERRDGQRTVQVTADTTPKSKAGEITGDIYATILPKLAEKYPGLSFGFEGQQLEAQETMGALKVGFVIGLLVVYALIALPFRSYWQPAIVMVAIPFGMIGAIIGHMIMGFDLSIVSVFGIVALSGVVVNDSLVLVDFANQHENEMATPTQRILEAGVQRFRPVMLTTLTTFGGLAPMIFETSRQARFLIPMALSLGYGILFATVITLFLIPCLYVIEADVRKACTWVFRPASRSTTTELSASIPT